MPVGWWRVRFDPTNPDVIGERPADILDEALEQITDLRGSS
jgi:aryl-phospho-beta-D-glucosidase BglC (GH1 family)